MAEKKSAECCGKIVAHTKNGAPYAHTCDSPTAVTPSPESVPPVFPASYESECDTCGDQMYEGDLIRSDGDGGWECEDHAFEREGEPCTHPNDFTWADDGKGHSGWHCEKCGILEPNGPASDGPCVSEGIAHVFTWNAAAGESQCIGCGTPDSGALKAARVADKAPVQAVVQDEVIVASHTLSDSFTTSCTCSPYDNGHQPACPLMSRTGVLDPAIAHTQTAVSAAIGLSSAKEGTEADGDAMKALDAFSAPAEVAEKLNVSGQPPARYEWWGKQNRGYLTKLPETGDFRRYGNGKPRGIARATTFNKAASDQNAISDWGKRNVLIGASLRPDLVAKAHGLTHETDTAALMSLVAQLETAAGAKVSSDIGTLIHELTEQWDADALDVKDVPAAYWPMLQLYAKTLREAGLRPVRGLIERTTYIPEYGGVVGTMDRVYYHERSGQYIIGDVKTGKTLKYGMDEIEVQEWIYAHGVNVSGVYDWNTDTWRTPENSAAQPEKRPLRVSEEWGVVIHMPVQGDDAGKCFLVRADLQRGRRHADVCHDVRTQRSNKPKPELWTGTELGAPQTAAEPVAESLVGWEHLFTNVQSSAQAHDLWENARAGGVEPMRLDALVQLAQQRLREIGAS